MTIRTTNQHHHQPNAQPGPTTSAAEPRGRLDPSLKEGACASHQVKVVTDLLASIDQAGGIASPNVVALSRNLASAQTLHDDLITATRSYERQYVEVLKLAEAYREIAAAAPLGDPERDRAHLAWCRAMSDMAETGNTLGEAHWRLKWLLEFEYPYDEDGGKDHTDEDGGEQ
jgi:hypothetical protein